MTCLALLFIACHAMLSYEAKPLILMSVPFTSPLKASKLIPQFTPVQKAT
jgi:hypothetical protein